MGSFSTLSISYMNVLCFVHYTVKYGFKKKLDSSVHKNNFFRGVLKWINTPVHIRAHNNNGQGRAKKVYLWL